MYYEMKIHYFPLFFNFHLISILLKNPAQFLLKVKYREDLTSIRYKNFFFSFHCQYFTCTTEHRNFGNTEFGGRKAFDSI